MNTARNIEYRIALATGFLNEAEQDFTLGRWRSCVDNAQLAVENAGKAALTLFGIAPKTYDPARQIAVVLREQELPANISESILSDGCAGARVRRRCGLQPHVARARLRDLETGEHGWPWPGQCTSMSS